jgi:hypothetical protein
MLPDNIEPTSNLPDFSQYFTPDIVALFAEVAKSRSDFQLEKFVINQHPTKEMQYFQCVLELQTIYYDIKRMELEVKKSEIEIARLRATGDEIDEIDAQMKELGLEQVRLRGVSQLRELETLLNILKTFPRYTREEIENGQAEYWNIRLHKQAELQRISATPNEAAHLESLIQIGALEYKLPQEAQIENEKDKPYELR